MHTRRRLSPMPPSPPTTKKIWKSLRKHCLLHSFGLWKGSCLRLLILGHLNIVLEGTVVEVGQPTWVSANIHLLFHRFLGFLCFGGICWRACSGFHVDKGLPSGMEWPCGQRPLHLKLNSLLLTISFSPQSSFTPDLGFSTVAPLLPSGRKSMEPCVERWTCRHRPVETQHVLYFL